MGIQHQQHTDCNTRHTAIGIKHGTHNTQHATYIVQLATSNTGDAQHHSDRRQRARPLRHTPRPDVRSGLHLVKAARLLTLRCTHECTHHVHPSVHKHIPAHHPSMHIQHEHTRTRTWSGSTYSCHAGLLRGSRHSHHISARGLSHFCAATVPHLRRDCPTSALRLPRSLIGIWPAATRLARRSRFGTPSPRSTCGSRSSRRDRPSRTTYDRGKPNACVCVRACVDVPVRARD